MTFRLRYMGVLIGAAIALTVGGWFTGFIPLIYLMPLVVLQGLTLSLACPRCGKSPFRRQMGLVRVSWPTPGPQCWNCEFPFRDFAG